MSEKMCIIAGPQFGPLQGHLLIIVKVMYGVRTNGVYWYKRLADVLCSERFCPWRVEPNIQIQGRTSLCEYINVYMNDLAIAMVDPQNFNIVLREKHKF